MKLISAEAMREGDRRTIEDLGFPGIVLMENAGMRITEAVTSISPLPEKVIVLAGPGNNGGDGLVTARQLNRLGISVSVWCAASPQSYKGDARVNHDFLEKKGFPLNYVEDETRLEELQEDIKSADLLIDALLGTGTGRLVEGVIADIIALLNAAKAPVLSVDIPSGIDANTGKVLGIAVKAKWTVTLASLKRGHLLHPGAEYAGKVTVADIDIPERAIPSEAMEVITPERVIPLLPRRPLNAHKGTFGRALIVAGSPGMSGAALLTGESALRGGAGLVHLATARGLRGIIEAKTVEIITQNLPEDGEGYITSKAADILLEWAGKCQVLAIGPGLFPGEETYRLLGKLVPECPVPMVIDAGGLGALAAAPELLLKARSPVVITPHPGEMARLTGLKMSEVEEERLDLPARMAQTWRFVVVLKGAPTVVAFPDGSSWVNPTGGPVLASAGTGDLLTGLITGLISQGLTAEESSVCGVYLHGLAGDLTAQVNRETQGMKAGDVLQRFPAAFQTLLEHKWDSSEFGPFHRQLRHF